ncbi:MAG: transketolase [Candidatus Paceibacterota bacterium]|jgi:transketolase
MSLNSEQIKKLELQANQIRQTIIEALVEAKSGHTAGPLDMADIFTYLYFHKLKHNPQKPDWPDRDRLVLSNGHICPVLYATMSHAGYFSVDEFKKTLRKFGTKFQGHPHRDFMPELETSSGPLGSGLSQTVGMALADRVDNGKTSGRQFYCLMSDGELDCGNSWEGAMLAGKEKLQNLTAIVDRNNIQIDGFTEDIMPLNPLADKWRAWNWHVQEIDGHNFVDIDRAIGDAHAVFDKPSVIIANTIASKGVPQFERKFEWHGKPPNKEEGEMALKELRTLGGKIRSEHE